MKIKIKLKINIISDDSLVIHEYIINLQNKSKKIIEKIEVITKLKNLEDIKKDINDNIVKDTISKKSYKKNGFKKKKFFKKKFFKKSISTPSVEKKV